MVLVLLLGCHHVGARADGWHVDVDMFDGPPVREVRAILTFSNVILGGTKRGCGAGTQQVYLSKRQKKSSKIC